MTSREENDETEKDSTLISLEFYNEKDEHIELPTDVFVFIRLKHIPRIGESLVLYTGEPDFYYDQPTENIKQIDVFLKQFSNSFHPIFKVIDVIYDCDTFSFICLNLKSKTKSK